jgi:intracellular sulfur oxidation DsrE/DsrF family protein
MTADHYTVLESEHVGLVCLGDAETVGRLIFQARELQLTNVALMSQAGIFFVACDVDWRLREVPGG